MKISVIVISGLLYMLLILGMVIIFGRSIEGLFNAFSMRRLSRRARLKREDPVSLHFERLTSSALGGRISGNGLIFLLLLIFASVAFVAMRSFSIAASIAIALIAACLPYMLLRMRLESLRARASFEGESFIAELLSSYRIEDHNIYAAMERTGEAKGDFRTSKRLLMRLLYSLRESGSEREARIASDEFAYGINTNWSRMLAYNLWVAAMRGTNISLALEDILIQLREARSMQEERRRLNSEAARMTVFLVPLLYIFTVFASVRYLNVGIGDFLRNQFFTQQGFLFISAAVFLFFGNLVLMEIVNNMKFDY